MIPSETYLLRAPTKRIEQAVNCEIVAYMTNIIIESDFNVVYVCICHIMPAGKRVVVML